MYEHPLYTLSASELVQDSFQSELVETFAKVLTGFREVLIDKTDDFERWDTKTQNVLYKMLKEFNCDVVFKGGGLITSLLNRPEFLWTLIKLNPSKSGLELFFRLLGVYEGLETTISSKKTLFYKDRASVQDIDSCKLSITINTEGVNDANYLAYKIEAVNIFNLLKVEMCSEYKIDVQLSAVKSTFATTSLVEERITCITPTIKYARRGYSDFPVTGVFGATQKYEFTAPLVIDDTEN